MGLLGLGIGEWTDIGVALATLVLAAITARTIKEMRLQQRKDKLHKEMILLVGPLQSHQDSHYYFGLWQNHAPRRNTSNDAFNSKTYYDFWDGIRINMHLAHPDLLRALQEYLKEKDGYWEMIGNRAPLAFDNNSEAIWRRGRVDTTRDALRLETDRRFESLRREIDQLEQQRSWQFW